MPFKMTNYLEKQVLKLVLEGNAGSWSPPAHAYLGLFTAFTEASDGDVFTEVPVSGTGYARQICAFGPVSNASTSNTSLIDFPMATTAWGNIIYWGLFDAVTNGNMLYWGQVGTPQVVNVSEQFEVAAAGVSVSISGSLTTYLANNILNHSLLATAYSPPASIWTAIFTAYTSDTAYTELSDANYLRQQGTFSVPVDLVTDVSNTNSITFPAMTADYTANYVALFDAASGGNLLLRGPVSPTKLVNAGKLFRYPAGALTVTAD